VSKAGKSASDHPRRVSVDGKEDLVLPACEKEGGKLTAAALVEAFAHRVSAGLEIDREQITGVHREVDL
jgi:hypothetical protein